MSSFIFMLTLHDRTVDDALDLIEEMQDAPVDYVGFKDVGLPFDVLRKLADKIRASGRTTVLEMVSEQEEDELRSARAAVDLGVDYLLGGVRPDKVLPIIRDTSLRYCPFPGKITGHPSRLGGTVGDIVQHARTLAAMPGVYGLDLLAYRYGRSSDVERLLREVVEAVSVPVIAAGSIDSDDRIRTVARTGAWGFTIGSAIITAAPPFDQPDLKDRLAYAVRQIDSGPTD